MNTETLFQMPEFPAADRYRIREAKLIFSSTVNEAPAARCDSSENAVACLNGAFDAYPEQEQFWVLLLDRKCRLKGRVMITLGIQTSSLCHPREVFRAAVIGGACAIICAHNHPSGDPAPSTADIRATRQLKEAARVLDIDLLDHVIIGTKAHDPAGLGFYSFRDAGVL